MARLELVSLGLLITLCLVAAQTNADCEECDRGRCPTLDPVQCLAGIVRDHCDCCQVCARAEREECDLHESGPHGACGDHMVCRSVPGGESGVGICQCVKDDVICGTDGVTYNNLCALVAESQRTEDRTLKQERKGRCFGPPRIVSKPENTRNRTGENVILSCEVEGPPTPYIAWSFQRIDGEVIYLPGDDIHVSTSSRGGSEKYRVTGWIQIMDIQKEHEGDYTCEATNKMGTDKAMGRVKVKEDRDL